MSSNHRNTADPSQLQGDERERVIRKIKSCLALSGSSNQNEANTALRQAQTMMARYRLTDADVAASAVDSAGRSAKCKDVPRWHRDLATVAAKSMGCIVMRTVYKNLPIPSQFTFVGVAPACELAAYAYDSLLSQIKRDRADFLRTSSASDRNTTRRHADDFCAAWVSQVHKQVMSFAAANDLGQDNSRALVVLAERDKAAIDAWMKAKHGDVPEARQPKPRSVHAASFFRGIDAGKHAKLHQAVNGQNPAVNVAGLLVNENSPSVNETEAAA